MHTEGVFCKYYLRQNTPVFSKILLKQKRKNDLTGLPVCARSPAEIVVMPFIKSHPFLIFVNKYNYLFIKRIIYYIKNYNLVKFTLIFYFNETILILIFIIYIYNFKKYLRIYMAIYYKFIIVFNDINIISVEFQIA